MTNSAMALEINRQYFTTRVIVVSDDVVDHMPRKESVKTACDRLDLEHWRAEQFVTFIRAHLEEATVWR